MDTATRKMWTPYLVTYLREAYDRGYPLIRPLPMEFSRDKDMDRQNDVFMLGDEVLMAPVVGSGRQAEARVTARELDRFPDERGVSRE